MIDAALKDYNQFINLAKMNATYAQYVESVKREVENLKKSPR
jgi:hypothetical protein